MHGCDGVFSFHADAFFLCRGLATVCGGWYGLVMWMKTSTEATSPNSDYDGKGDGDGGWNNDDGEHDGDHNKIDGESGKNRYTGHTFESLSCKCH